MSLFGSRGAPRGGAPVQPQRPSRTEFKAGRMVMTGTTVTALPEKGLVYVEKDDAGMSRFCWANRENGNVEEELIVFPDAQKFMKCKSAPESSRVYYLKINDTRHFFWMQDADASKDEENCANLNRAMNGEAVPAPGTSSAPIPGLPAGMAAGDQQQLMQLLGLGSMVSPQRPAPTPAPASSAIPGLPAGMGAGDQQQLMQMLGLGSSMTPPRPAQTPASAPAAAIPGLPAGMGAGDQQQLMQMLGLGSSMTPPRQTQTPAAPSTPSHPTRAPARRGAPGGLSGLERLAGESSLDSSTLSTDGNAASELNTSTGSNDGSKGTAGGDGDMAAQQQMMANLLMQGLANESQRQGMMGEGASLTDVLTVSNIEPLLADPEVVARLAEHLPEDSAHSSQEILDTIRSPQFSERLQSFTAALQSGELGPVMSQFGVDPTTVLGAGVLGLLEALSTEAGDTEEGEMDQGGDE